MRWRAPLKILQNEPMWQTLVIYKNTARRLHTTFFNLCFKFYYHTCMWKQENNKQMNRPQTKPSLHFQFSNYSHDQLEDRNSKQELVWNANGMHMQRGIPTRIWKTKEQRFATDTTTQFFSLQQINTHMISCQGVLIYVSEGEAHHATRSAYENAGHWVEINHAASTQEWNQIQDLPCHLSVALINY